MEKENHRLTQITSKSQIAVFTIGHSTHPISEFIEIMKGFTIRRIVDVRTIPKSRHNPQFNREKLERSLKAEGIDYLHMPGLGGLRHTKKDSLNTAWKNASFRGFADYMQTEEFDISLGELIEISHKQTVAIMCAEAVPWRCHRSLIGDALLVRGIEVQDITGRHSVHPHTLTPWAKIEGRKITYPGEPTR
jgi:uncharacterized protein (DUF488 family)